MLLLDDLYPKKDFHGRAESRYRTPSDREGMLKSILFIDL